MLEIDITTILSHLLQLGVAFVLAMPIAWERENQTRIMGLRTFPLVSLGSCAFILIGTSIVGENSDANARLIQGLVSGLGFIGGGAILKENGGVRGTATAASVWVTGATGTAVGFGRYEIAIVIVLLNFIILRWLTPIKQAMNSDQN